MNDGVVFARVGLPKQGNIGQKYNLAAMNPSHPPDFSVIANAQVKRAFLGGKPDVVEWLEPGTKLYKWTKSIISSQGITPWWFFIEPRVLPNGIRVEGLKDRQAHAMKLGVADREFHRVRGGSYEAVESHDVAYGYQNDERSLGLYRKIGRTT